MAAGEEEKRAETLYVLYDGQCMLCTGTVARLRSLPARASLRFVTAQSVERGEPEAVDVPGYASLHIPSLYDKIHVVEEDGAVYAGADGVVRILRTLPGWGWAAWLYRIPGMKRIADKLYRYVAGRRYDWFGRTDEGCPEGACRLPVSK